MIKIFTPYNKNLIYGNFSTATRYAQLLNIYHLKSIVETNFLNANRIKKGDLVIVLHAFKGYKIVKMCKERMVPCVLVITGTDLYKNLENDHIEIKKKCVFSIKNSSAIIVLNKNAAHDLYEKVKVREKKVFVIYQSVAVNSKKTIFFKNKSSYSVLMVGNIRQEKDYFTGIQGFLSAFPNGINDYGQKIYLNHIGGVLDYRYFLELLTKINKSNIIFHGTKLINDTHQIMKSSDLLLHPSSIEGGSLVISEALNINLPIIASDISCHRSILGKNFNGLFKMGNFEDLGLKLSSFFKSETFRNSMEQQMYKNTLRSYTNLSEANQLLEVVSFVKYKA